MAMDPKVAQAWSVVFSAARLAKLSAEEHQTVFHAAQQVEAALAGPQPPSEPPVETKA